MARGKYLSLEEARNKGLKRFAKEHPCEGNELLFDHPLAVERSEELQ